MLLLLVCWFNVISGLSCSKSKFVDPKCLFMPLKLLEYGLFNSTTSLSASDYINSFNFFTFVVLSLSSNSNFESNFLM